MWKRIRIGIAVLVIAVVGADLVYTNMGGDLFGGGHRDERRETHARLANVAAELTKAGTARVAFKAGSLPSMGSQMARWEGTSLIRFGPALSWDTAYSTLVSGREPAVRGQRLRIGDHFYFSSPGLRLEPGRTWIDEDRTEMYGGNPLADPALGVADLTTWLPFLTDVTEANANNAVTGALTDVPGAEYEFRLRCTPGHDRGCPPPFGTDLDKYVNEVITYPRLDVWLDKRGRLLRLEVADVSVRHNPAGQGGTAGDVPPNYLRLTATFELRDFGAPLTVAAPPAEQIAGQDRVPAPYQG